MPIYAISYDLNSPGQKYEQVKQKIESCGDCIKAMESFWLVDSLLTEQQISDRILSAHDSNDRHLVLKISSRYSGFLTDNVWQWLVKRQHKLAA